MKKIASILLIGILLFQLTGYHWYFRTQRSLIRKSVKEKLRQSLRGPQPESMWTVSWPVGQPLQNMQWVHGDEVLLDGTMYDILAMDTANGMVTAHGIADKDETQWVKQYNHLLKNQWGKPLSKRAALLLQLASLHWLVEEPAAPAFVTSYKQPMAGFYQYALPVFHTDILTPPPQLG